MSKIKFAVLGCGRIGLKHIDFIQNNDEAELVAIIDKNINEKEIIHKYKFNSLDEFLNSNLDVDIVSIATPNGYHAQNSLQILESGMHVLIEKPMALNKKDAEKIIKKSIDKNKKIFVVMQNRYSPILNSIKNAVEKNNFGEIYFININCFWNRNNKYFDNHEWHGNLKNDGGVLFTQFSHFIDAIYWIFGDFINIETSLKKFLKNKKIQFEDTGTVKFELFNGAICNFNFTISSYNKHFESSISIISQKGNIKIEGQYLDEVSYYDTEKKFEIKDHRSIPDYYNNYDNRQVNHALVVQNAIDVLKNNSEIKTNALDGLKVIEIIEKIYEKGR